MPTKSDIGEAASKATQEQLAQELRGHTTLAPGEVKSLTPAPDQKAGSGEEAVLVRAREFWSEIPETELPPREFMWMPAGVHTISAHAGPKMTPATLAVRVDKGTAELAQAELRRISAGGHRPFFDFEHREREASAWPEEFYWEDGASGKPAGVYVRASWSNSGAEAVSGKTFRGFSPTFTVDKLVADEQSPARLKRLRLVMGGLTNVPAFEGIVPLWARGQVDLADVGQAENQKKEEQMNKEKLAQMAAKLVAVEAEINSVRARKATEGEDANVVAAREAQVQARESEARALRAEIRAGELELDIKARNTKLADAAIQGAVKRGAIAAADETIQARYRSLIETDPANVVLVESLPGNPALGVQITAGQSRIEVGQEDARNVIRAYQAELNPLKAGEIYASGLRTLMSKEEGAEMVIRAANTLGTASGGIVVQRALDLLKLSFPVLSRISTNFSNENAAYGEAITTRLVTVPAVGTYHVDNGYVSQAAVLTDVPVTIDAHQFVQVEFNANEIGGTRRLLFGEQEDAMHYALGLDLLGAIYALFTAANFAEAPTVEALVNFDRASVIQVGTDMQVGSAGRNANTGTRTLLLASDYYGKLAEDVVIVGGMNNPGAGQAISSGVLPMVHGFLPVEAPNLLAAGNLKGFGLRADAVAMAVRPANDYAASQPGLPATGVVQQITNPDTGLTVSLVRFVDHKLGKSYMRIAWMRGAAKGNPKAGQRLVSAAP